MKLILYIAYEEGIKSIWGNRAAFDYRYNKGIAEGKNNKAIEIAKNLLLQNTPLDIISTSIGLSIFALQKLKG